MKRKAVVNIFSSLKIAVQHNALNLLFIEHFHKRLKAILKFLDCIFFIIYITIVNNRVFQKKHTKILLQLQDIGMFLLKYPVCIKTASIVIDQ